MSNLAAWWRVSLEGRVLKGVPAGCLIDITCRFCYSCANLAIGFNFSGFKNPDIDMDEGVFFR